MSDLAIIRKFLENSVKRNGGKDMPITANQLIGIIKVIEKKKQQKAISNRLTDLSIGDINF